MSITYVTFDGTVDAGGWTLSAAVAAHTLLQTVDQPGSESTFAQATGVGAGTLKLSIAPGPANIARMNYVRHAPLLIAGTNAANFPLLRAQLYVGGMLLSSIQYEVDSSGDFFLAAVDHGPLALLGATWYAGPRQAWFSTVSAVFHDHPIPEWG